MKKVFFLLFLFPFLVQSQETKPTGPFIPIAAVDQPPVYRNCEGKGINCTIDAITGEILQNINWSILTPEERKKPLVTNLKLIVDSKGKVAWATVVGASEEIKKEGVRILKELPKFTPGKHEGKEANVILDVPVKINFGRISDTEVYAKTPHEELDSFAFYPNCENGDKKKCTSEQITDMVNQSFNPSGLKKGYYKTTVSFVIDKTGKIRNIIAEGPNEQLNKRGINVVKTLPDLLPAIKDGVATDIAYLLPITVYTP